MDKLASFGMREARLTVGLGMRVVGMLLAYVKGERRGAAVNKRVGLDGLGTLRRFDKGSQELKTRSHLFSSDSAGRQSSEDARE